MRKRSINFSLTHPDVLKTVSKPTIFIQKKQEIVGLVIKTFIIVSLLLILPHQGNKIISAEESNNGTIETTSGSAVHIAFTGEENGYLEPCGCSDAQLGGFPKRHTLISQLRKKDEDLILLSLGDLPDRVGRQAEIKLETSLMALEQMGYTAHNIGEKDINMGPDLLIYLSQISNVDFLSSNIIPFNAETLKIKPYIIKEIKKNERILKVCILGIVSPSLIENVYEEIEIADPIDSLKPLLDSLKDKTDILILLSHAEMEYSKEISEVYPEFDIIITGHGVDRPDLYLEKVKNTWIIPVGEKGKYLGTIDMLPRYRHSHNYLPVGNPEYYGLSIKRREPIVDIIALDEKFDDSPEMKTLLKSYQQRLKEEEIVKGVFKTNPPSGLSFIGNNDCAPCHNKIFKHWEETGHAVAYETLVKVEHEYDPECLRCHVIGLNYFTGFETIESTPDFRGVGCESCHGPGSDHKETQSKGYGKADVGNCISCHEGEHSPHFQYKDYWQKIMHPGEDK